jgi:ATP-dependent Clp protease ATP-binding subunit ClpA
MHCLAQHTNCFCRLSCDEADPTLARRFTPVWIEEPLVEEAIGVVEAVAQQHLGQSHQVQYPDDVIREATHLPYVTSTTSRVSGPITRM